MDPFTSRVSLCLLHSSLGNFLLKRLTTTSYLYTACPLSSCVAHASYKTASFCGTPLQISSFCHAPKSSKLWPHQQKELPIHARASSEQFQQHQTSIPVVGYQKEPRAYVAILPPGTDHCVLAQASHVQRSIHLLYKFTRTLTCPTPPHPTHVQRSIHVLYKLTRT